MTSYVTEFAGLAVRAASTSNSRRVAITYPGAGAWKVMGRCGIGRECVGNVMGSALGKRGKGMLGPKVVARWDAGVDYFFQVGLDEIRHGRGRENGARGWPGVTLGAGAGASVGGAGTGAVRAMMGSLRYGAVVLKGVGTV